MRLGRLFRLACKSLWLHRLRSLLTVLGIVFGVGSVVAMLAIGEGASQEAQEQIRRMGSRNILLASVPPPDEGDASQENSRVSAYGLLQSDLEGMRETIQGIRRFVPRRDIPSEARYGRRKFNTVIMGTTHDYVELANLQLATGRFLNARDAAYRASVCVLGASVRDALFKNIDPVGLQLRIGRNSFRIVGTLETRGEGTGATAGYGGESDAAVFIPLETMKRRYGQVIRHNSSGSWTRERIELHRITVESESDHEDDIARTAAALRHFLKGRHPKNDVRVTVPQELLRQARETKRRFTIILGSIAAISLLVGGIGIMNIMLATVVERTREVGVRRALGARRSHIIAQFLSETVLLSIGGGLLGLALGVALPKLVTKFFHMATVVDPRFLILAFGISALVGLVFGMYPAIRAADLDPVEALRHE